MRTISLAALSSHTMNAGTVARELSRPLCVLAAVCALLVPAIAESLALEKVVSRKTHAGAGVHDLALTAGPAIWETVTIEPREAGEGHLIVFRFDSAISAIGAVSVFDDAGNPIAGFTSALAGNEVRITLPDIGDNRRAQITLDGVNGSAATSSVAVGFLVGDVNLSGLVTAGDISGIKARRNIAVDATNFIFDIDRSGEINQQDVSMIKARTARVLKPGYRAFPRAESQVTIAPTVPPAIAQGIVTVLSPSDAQPPGQIVRSIQPGSGRDSVLLALDAVGNIVMAGIARSGGVELDAQSTAVALARLAMGPLPRTLTSSAFDAAVIATPAFPALLQAILAAWQSGIPVSDSVPVMEQAMVAVSQAMSSLLPAPAAREAVLIDSPLTLPLPYKIIPNEPFSVPVPISVYLTGTGGRLENNMPISWTGISKDGAGNPYGATDTNPTGGMLVEGVDLFNLAMSLGNGKITNVPDNGGNGYNLTITQSQQSRIRNQASIVQATFSLALDAMLSAEGVVDLRDRCDTELVNYLTNASELQVLALAPSWDAFNNYVKSTAFSVLPMISVFEKCWAPGTNQKTFLESLNRYVKPFFKLYDVFSKAKLGADSINLANKVYLYALHYDTTARLNVCQSSSGISVCPTAIALESPSPYWGIGASFPLTVRAFANGSPVGVPNGMRFETSAPAVAALPMADSSLVNAVGLGSATITARYPLLPAVVASRQLDVVEPAISPATEKILPGEGATFSLVWNSQYVFVLGSRLYWEIGIPGVARPNPLNEFVSNLFGVIGQAPGTTPIYAANEISGRITSASLEVVPSGYSCPMGAVYYQTSCTLTPQIDTTFKFNVKSIHDTDGDGFGLYWHEMTIGGVPCNNSNFLSATPIENTGLVYVTESCTRRVAAGTNTEFVAIAHNRGATNISIEVTSVTESSR